jgi:hypothetical protein
MQDNFNLAKYLRHGNKLLNENIGGYVDLKPINELNDLGMTEDMDDVDRLLKKWKDDPSTDPQGDWRNKPYDQAQASAQDWFDEYEEEGRLDEFYGMSVEELIEALELFGEPDAENVAPILHKMINQEDDDSMSLEELMGTAMEIDELEKPKSIYATDDSEDEKGFDVPGDDDDFIDGFEETRENAQRAFVDAIESLRQMSFEDDDIIDMFKTAFYGK